MGREKLPQEWEKGVLVKIPKRGDLSNCDNWCGIILLSVPSKVFNRVILNRLEGEVETKLSEEQYGYRPQRSCTDLINVLRIIREQSLEWNSPLYLAFVDFAKASDSVRRYRIWNEIEGGGITRYNYNSSLMMEGVHTSETSVDNHFTRQYIPEDNSEHNYKGNVLKFYMLCIT
jgi:hypothetical protein